MKEQMSNVIAELSRIENDALAIIGDTETRQKNFALNIEKKKKEYDDLLNAQTEEKLADISVALNKESENDLMLLRKEAQENMAKLEASFKINHSIWAKEVLDSIIKE